MTKSPKKSKNKKRQTTKKKRKKPDEPKERTDKEFNGVLIAEEFVKFLRDNNRRPTYKELAKITKLSEKTIQRHVQTLRFEPNESLMKVLTDDVILSIYKSALMGSPSSQKLWLQIFAGFKDRISVEDKKTQEELELMQKLLDLDPETLRKYAYGSQ